MFKLLSIRWQGNKEAIWEHVTKVSERVTGPTREAEFCLTFHPTIPQKGGPTTAITLKEKQRLVDRIAYRNTKPAR